MTRSKIQKMKFFVFLLIFLLAQTVHCDGSFREKRATPTIEVKDKAGVKEPPAITAARGKNGGDEVKPVPEPKNKTLEVVEGISKSGSDATTVAAAAAAAAAAAPNKTVHTADTSDEHSSATTFNTGALVRGFLVFVGLSALVMAYIVFRSFRLSKTRAQMVRKYGVLTHRQDVEMRPLPLEEEDDEDTTVFDASNVLTNNVQHQNA